MSEKIRAMEGQAGDSGSHHQQIQNLDWNSSAKRRLTWELMEMLDIPGSKKLELESLLSGYELRKLDKETESVVYESPGPSNTRSRSLRLNFLNKIGESVFAGEPIIGENGQRLMVALVDGQSGEVVPVGPEASARVEIVPLEPDFGRCLGDSWTSEEFKDKIVRKEGNKGIFTGDFVLNLKEGKCYVDNLKFTLWLVKREFRLGAIAVDDNLPTKIREGYTNSFFVKDHLRNLNDKLYPPNLFDDVWRLKDIASGGTSNDLLRELVIFKPVEDLLEKRNTTRKPLDFPDKSKSAKQREPLVDTARISYELGLSQPNSVSDKTPGPSITGSRSLHLKFLSKIGELVYTGVPIKGENGQPLMVALVDGESEEVVTVSPEASARVEIVPLDPDFCDLGDSWTSEEFKMKIVREEGYKRLVRGNMILNLKNGIGCAGNFQFSHTKAWKMKRAFRLGAIAVDDNLQPKIKEGFTNPFFLKDRRLEWNMKHHPPNLSDEVWRLEGIAKHGAFHRRLSEVNINTVEDFLKILNTDLQKLRDILGKGISNKMWKVLTDHARTCVVDEKLYLYSSECSQETGVIFNIVGQVKRLVSGPKYISFEMLTEPEKAHAMNLVASAFQQWDKVVPFDDEALLQKLFGPKENVSCSVESSSGITSEKL